MSQIIYLSAADFAVLAILVAMVAGAFMLAVTREA